MIVVAGFNTAIDTLVDVEALQPGTVHRHRDALRLPGGKGIHVAQTIAALGMPVALVGLTDAVNGEAIASHLQARGIAFHGIPVPRIRECLAIRERDGRITELLDAGLDIAADTVDALRTRFLELAADASLAVLSGSLPRGCPETLYADLVNTVQASGVRCLVDTSGAALQATLQATPFLLKPNRDEAADLLQRPIDSIDAAIAAVTALHARGIRMPLLSLGEDGALSMDDGQVLRGQLALDAVVNPVGSGDCMLAAVAVALAHGESASDALRLGIAGGAANAAERETGFLTPARVQALLPRVQLTRHAPSTPHEAPP